MIVVFDTSSLAPAIIPISQSRRLIDRLVGGGHLLSVNQLIVSRAIMHQILGKLGVAY